MTRQIRIIKAQSWYYVRNSVRTGSHLFKSQSDLEEFLHLLKEAKEKFKFEISAYYLGSTGYQLLLFLPNKNLSEVMRHLNGVYTQYYNRRYDSDGSLFKGRFQASLVQSDEYPLWISKLIHQYENIEDKLFSSSASGYTLLRNKASILLDTNPILEELARCFPNQNYQAFLLKRLPIQLIKIFSRKTLPSIIGNSDFCQNEKIDVLAIPEDQLPQFQSIDASYVVEKVAQYFGLTKKQVCQSRSSHSNARNIAMLLARMHSPLKLTQLATLFEVSHYASISNRVSHTKRALNSCEELHQDFSCINDILIKNTQQLSFRG